MINGKLTSAEVAQLLRVSQRTVTRMAADGTLEPAERLDVGRGVLLFDPDAVAAIEVRRRKVDAPARASALDDAADAWEATKPTTSPPKWLRKRAGLIRDGSI